MEHNVHIHVHVSRKDAVRILGLYLLHRLATYPVRPGGPLDRKLNGVKTHLNNREYRKE